mmetsp:Transcript_60890/g.106639  ORF Transcript_60890/g.106639 Transcript_60890/m.106639 type:complete len:115 (+) Transcript_60890:202-546(+)
MLEQLAKFLPVSPAMYHCLMEHQAQDNAAREESHLDLVIGNRLRSAQSIQELVVAPVLSGTHARGLASQASAQKKIKSMATLATSGSPRHLQVALLRVSFLNALPVVHTTGACH